MKKSIRLMLALVAALSLFAAACGSDGVTDDVVDAVDDAADSAADAVEDAADAVEDAADDAAAAGDAGLVYDIGGRGDLSFNDSAAAGLEKAAAELGYATTEASPNDDGSNRAELLQLAADSNEIVLAVGFLFAGDAAEAAAANPDVNFAVIDDGMLNFDTGEPVAPNAAGLVFAEEQGSFPRGRSCCTQE